MFLLPDLVIIADLNLWGFSFFRFQAKNGFGRGGEWVGRNVYIRASRIFMLTNHLGIFCESANSDPVGLGQGPRFSISKKLPGDADAAGVGSTLCGC